MALEDVTIVLQLFNHGGQRRVNLYGCHPIINQITNRDIILLGLNIKQIVNGNREIVPSDVRIVDGDRDVLLLLRRIAQQRFHPLSQASVVLNPNG